LSTRRGWGEDGIFFEHTAPGPDSEKHRHCQGRWRGVVSLGFGPDGIRIRRQVSGKTRTMSRAKVIRVITHIPLLLGVQGQTRWYPGPGGTYRAHSERVRDWPADAHRCGTMATR
jgi:hypothetical protein